MSRLRSAIPLQKFTLVALVVLATLALSGVAQANTFSISGSMEGAIKIANGDNVAGGYSFALSGNNVDTRVLFANAKITFTGACSNGGSDTLTLPLRAGDASGNPYLVAAGDGNWQPTGNEQVKESFQGSVVANVCGGAGTLDASKGATFSADLQADSTVPTVAIRFHYRDPNAKGKGNWDCSAQTGDASTCGASWSGTAHLQPGPIPANPQLNITKAVDKSIAHVGDPLNYTIVVSNPGNTLLHVTLSDFDQANSAVSGCTFPTGTNMKFDLAAGGSQTFTCEKDAPAGVSSYTNVACADAPNPNAGGTPLHDCDTATTTIIHPGIAVVKDVDKSSAPVGTLLHYTINVSNTGDTPLTVTPADTGCDGFNGSAFQLGVGESQALNCTHTLTVADGSSYTNTACATGVDQIGGPKGTVHACDDATTTTTPPQQQTAPQQQAAPQQNVLGERVTPGTARLSGPTGCASTTFSARVKGTKITTVVFMLDGKVVKRFTKPVSGGLYTVRINPQQLRVGVHRVQAKVTFQQGTRTKPKTMVLSFQRCAKRLIAPRFTG